MRQLSLTYRLSLDARETTEFGVVLMKISTASGLVVRVSSDPTERLSVEPLTYGTRSTWLTYDGAPFQFIVQSVQVPDDRDELLPAAKMMIDGFDPAILAAFRSTTEQVRVDLGLVTASSPDVVEEQWLDLRLVAVEWNRSGFALSISDEQAMAEPLCGFRMSRQHLPGLFK
jgi:hypothetical protein